MAFHLLPGGYLAGLAGAAVLSVAAVGVTDGWDSAMTWGEKLGEGAAGAAAVARVVIPGAIDFYRDLTSDEDFGGGGEFRESPEDGESPSDGVMNASGVLPAASWSALYWAPGPGGVLSA